MFIRVFVQMFGKVFVKVLIHVFPKELRKVFVTVLGKDFVRLVVTVIGNVFVNMDNMNNATYICFVNVFLANNITINIEYDWS